jgi:mannose-6-phosphate isomerase
VGELWLAGPDVRVAAPGEPTLDDLAAALGESLVGRRGAARYGHRFPLIAKLIDAGDRLSLQVHPDDALARELYGAGAVGKCEAWLVLDATPGAELVTGPADGLRADALRAAVEAGEADARHCRWAAARAGDALVLRPGTLHAIGAGAFVYELEQPSDITFRISDWGRPTGRPLHRAEALRALRPEQHAVTAGSGFRLDGGALEVPEFRLELPDLASPLERRPAGRSCDVVTAIQGTVQLAGDGWAEDLAPYETLVVPACVERYAISGPAGGVVAVGSLP